MPQHKPSASEPADTTFLPRRVVRAADQAMSQVLEEDRLLRVHGIEPVNGRSL
jgi:hypothetical protein